MSDLSDKAKAAAGSAVVATNLFGVVDNVTQPYLMDQHQDVVISRDVSEMDLDGSHALEALDDQRRENDVELLEEAVSKKQEDDIAESYEALEKGVDAELARDAAPVLDIAAEATADDTVLGPMDSGFDLGADVGFDAGPPAGMDGGMGAG